MRKTNLSDDAIRQAAGCLRIISHPARLRIIQLLSSGPRTVGEIAEACDIAPNVASTHLKLLERCNLLANTRQGKTISYRITEKHLLDLLRCIEGRFGKER